jgi:hypothetical protein
VEVKKTTIFSPAVQNPKTTKASILFQVLKAQTTIPSLIHPLKEQIPSAAPTLRVKIRSALKVQAIYSLIQEIPSKAAQRKVQALHRTIQALRIQVQPVAPSVRICSVAQSTVQPATQAVAGKKLQQAKAAAAKK